MILIEIKMKASVTIWEPRWWLHIIRRGLQKSSSKIEIQNKRFSVVKQLWFNSTIQEKIFSIWEPSKTKLTSDGEFLFQKKKIIINNLQERNHSTWGTGWRLQMGIFLKKSILDFVIEVSHPSKFNGHELYELHGLFIRTHFKHHRYLLNWKCRWKLKTMATVYLSLIYCSFHKLKAL